MANSKNLLTGDTYTTKDKAIAISIERYNELIKKEFVFDELCKNAEPLVALIRKIEEVKK